MSEFFAIPTVIQTFTIVVFFVMAVSFIVWSLGDTTSYQVIDQKKIAERGQLFIAERCLKNGKPFIDASFLAANQAKSLCDLCGICYKDGKVSTTANLRVEDMSGNHWDIGNYVPPNTKEEAQSTFVNVKNSNDASKPDAIYLGKLTLRL